MWTCEDGMREDICERVENNTCIINPPHCFTQKCQKLSQFSNFWSLASLATHKNTANNKLLHTKHLPLPKKWHFCIHNTMFYVFLTSLAWSVILCVCSRIDSSEKNKFIIYQPLVCLDICYHKQFKLHSNWPLHHWPWILEVWIGNTILSPSPCLTFTTLCINPPCL
jgi:hypothetical protein